MDQHPMPRQITTFEFKLIGFLTLKQFIYLVVFIPLGFIVFKIFPIPLINILLAVLVGAIGPAFAFLPVNERPLDVWIKNLVKRLTSPTQYKYQKQNSPVYFLKNLFFLSDPHRVMTHVESEEKLAAYLAKTKKETVTAPKKQIITKLLQKPETENTSNKNPRVVAPTSPASPVPPAAVENKTIQPTPTPPVGLKKAFFSGVVKNHKLIPLPGVLIYVKNNTGEVVRLLKTNPHGVFATFSPLPQSEYQFDFKDPKGTYFFDTMKVKVDSVNAKPFEFFSKELM